MKTVQGGPKSKPVCKNHRWKTINEAAFFVSLY